MTQTEHFVLAKRYRLLHALGHGAMGTVWRAHDELLERDVAIKEIRFPAELDENERVVFYRRTLREARAPARVKHKSIIEVYDVVQEHARPWIVMELIEAPTLEQHIKNQGPLRPEEAAALGRQLVDALDEAHEAGVLHRDIKPSNVLLAPGRVVLTDFGLAVTNGSSTLTKAGTFVGSPAYVAPEVARGEKATPESDLWSLGATLYTAVEGRPPFDHENVMATLSAVLTDNPAPTQRAGELGPVISGLLQRNPKKRLNHAKLIERLERAATPRRSSAGMTIPPEQSLTSPSLSGSALPSRRSGAHRARQSSAARFRPFIVAGLPVVGVVAVIVAVFAFSGGDEQEPGGALTQTESPTQVSASPDALTIAARGGDCAITITGGGPNRDEVLTQTVTSGGTFIYNKRPANVTVSDANTCKVTIGGELQSTDDGLSFKIPAKP
ncbi:serine/threonine-protein kinase [Actinocorallia longicatena]|uniref:non-specific serine/threonine protein kinase n=1 Tax=Actinocorallia longicatena TaxID=111803 RepID=A0ABP6Q2D8_9ACTN